MEGDPMSEVYLDENGEPIPENQVYLDEQGNAIKGPPAMPEFSMARNLGKFALETVTEGGPAAIGAIGGGIVAGPAGAVLGGMGGELIRQQIRQRFGGGPAPQSNTEAVTQQLMAGASGALSPATAAARYPLAAQGGRYGSVVPKLMKGKTAQEIMATAQERRIAMTQAMKQRRLQAKNALREEKAAAQQKFNEQVERSINPLRKAKTDLYNQRTVQSAALAEQRTSTTEATRSALSQLNKATTEAKAGVSRQAVADAEAFTESVGREMNKIQIAKGTLEARRLGMKAYTDRATKLYDQLRDDIFANNKQKVPTGKTINTGVIGKDGKPIIQEAMREVQGPIDRTSLQEQLRPFVDNHRDKLTIAKQNGSPGAQAILEIVDGPAVIDGRTAIDDLAALNKFGYHKSDAELRSAGEALTRKVAGQYRTEFKKSIEKMKGGKEGLKLLDEAAEVLAQRDKVFRTGPDVDLPLARKTGLNVSQSGRVLQYVNDPLKMKALYNQVDEATRDGMKRQVAESLLGKSHRDFAKNWANLDPDVKALNFSSQQIVHADELARRGPAALEKIANDALAANTRIIQDATQKLKLIGEQRKSLGEITVKGRQLQSQITTEKSAIARAKTDKSLELQRKSAEMRGKLDEYEAQARQNFAIQIKVARQRIADIKEAKKKLLIGGAVVGAGSAAGWKMRNIAQLIGW